LWDFARGRASLPRRDRDVSAAVDVLRRLSLVQARRGFSADAIAAMNRLEGLRRNCLGASRSEYLRIPRAVDSRLRLPASRLVRRAGFWQWIEHGRSAGRGENIPAAVAARSSAIRRIAWRVRIGAMSDSMLESACESTGGKFPCEFAREPWRAGRIVSRQGRWTKRPTGLGAEQLQSRLGFVSDMVDYTRHMASNAIRRRALPRRCCATSSGLSMRRKPGWTCADDAPGARFRPSPCMATPAADDRARVRRDA